MNFFPTLSLKHLNLKPIRLFVCPYGHTTNQGTPVCRDAVRRYLFRIHHSSFQPAVIPADSANKLKRIPKNRRIIFARSFFKDLRWKAMRTKGVRGGKTWFFIINEVYY